MKKIPFVLCLFVIPFMFSGCVTLSKVRTGNHFSALSQEDLSQQLDTETGVLTKSEAVMRYGKPIEKTIDSTKTVEVLEWQDSTLVSRKYDIGVYTHTHQQQRNAVMALAFDRQSNALAYFVTHFEDMPIVGDSVSTTALVQVGVMYVNYRVLENVMNRALDRATDRADARLGRRIDQAKTELTDELNQAKSDLSDQWDDIKGDLNDQRLQFQDYLDDQWKQILQDLDEELEKSEAKYDAFNLGGSG